MVKRKFHAYLKLCDRCCDNTGTVKEMTKTGGCTCDVCGWSCKCSGDDAKQYVNLIPVHLIPEDGWTYLQRKNEESNRPLDLRMLFLMDRAREEKSRGDGTA